MDAIADLVRPFLTENSSRAVRVAALEQFRVRIAGMVHGRVSAAGVELPAIEVQRGGGRTLAIDIAVWRATSLADTKGMPGRIQRLRAAAEGYRDRRGGGIELAQMIVVVPGAEPPDLAQLGMGLAAAGMGRVVVCVASPAAEWYTLDGVGLAPVGGLDVALDHLVLDPALDPVPVLDPVQDEPSPRAGAAMPAAPPAAERPLRMLLVADEWHSTSGGISTVNRELGVALARAGVDVHVLVPTADPDVRAAARADGIHLVLPSPLPGLTGRELLLTPAVCEDPHCGASGPDVVVGHGRILGPYALAVQRSYFPAARRLHIVHTDADRLEEAKEVPGGASRMMTADERRELELELALSADLVAGIGPLLARTVKDAMRGTTRRPEVFTMEPGLRDWGGTVDPEDLPAGRQVLLLARAEDVRPKGIDLAVTMLRRAMARLGDRPGERPRLVIRGVQPEDDLAVKQRIDVLRRAAPDVEVSRRPYSSKLSALRTDLWSSRVVIMPSRHEGFGLAAYEAIAAGVPVLVTANSGLAELLHQHATDGERPVPREVVPVLGTDTEIADRWGDALAEVLVDPRAAFVRARHLREQLLERITWERTVAELIKLLADPPERVGSPRRIQKAARDVRELR